LASKAPPIDSFLEGVFLSEIENQCNTAITAFSHLKDNLHTMNVDLMWGLTEIILTSSANISKFFWPGPPRTKEFGVTKQEVDDRASYLKSILGIDDKSPLYDRDLRDHFEHYDERVQPWAKKSKNRVLFRRNIGAKLIGNIDQYANMGNLDPTTFTVTFWNKTYEIPIIIQEIEKILNATKDIAGKNHPSCDCAHL
jgi:hypothetical protein